MSEQKYSPVVLVIRDGWGANHDSSMDRYNAIKLAHTPCSDQLSAHWPRTEIKASGLDVGLPDNVMGNSEVGHQNIGAGRIVDQEIVRIDKELGSDAIRSSEVLQGLFEQAKKGGKLHLMGLASDAGVHSTLAHLYQLLKHARTAGLQEVYIHAFMDGRDTPPRSGIGFIREIEQQCRQIGIGKIASVAGRYWAMDRDQRWDRVEKAYRCLTGAHNDVPVATSAEEAVQHYYEHPLDDSRQSDEFVVPTRIVDAHGKPLGLIEDGDAVFFFNFRGDRPRELTRAFLAADFREFDRGPKLELYFATMTEYEKGLCPRVLFHKPPRMKGTLGMYVSEKGIPQFRCAETEKYPHVTFFFNDYRDEPFPGEDRVLVPSPREVATYDLKPEMSAYGICDAVEKAIMSGKYGLLVVNFANPDMVGHTGSLEATIKAVESVDICLARLLQAVDRMGGKAVITADHGNADQMWNPQVNAPHTQHTLNPVEVVVYGEGCEGLTLRSSGRLADIAPTLLDLMQLPQPSAMTGESLIKH